MQLVSIIIILFQLNVPQDNLRYVYEYDDKETCIAEGWMMGEVKVKFWKYYHANGVIKAKGHYDNGEKSGFWEYFFVSGKPRQCGHYFKGTKDKFWTFFSHGTKPKEQGHFKNGKREGYWITLDKKEQVVYEGRYENGQKTGFWISFKNKRPCLAEKFENGILMDSWDNLTEFKKDNKHLWVKSSLSFRH